MQSLALIQSISIAIQHAPVAAYRLGLWLLLSSIILVVVPVINLLREVRKNETLIDVVAILTIVEAAASLALALSTATLPRRPDVALNDRPVDRQRTVSVLSRYTWSWITPLLTLASVNQDLTPDDVPLGDHKLRSGDLQREWDAVKHRGTLLSSLAWAYKGRMVLLWAVTLVRGVLSVAPFWAMLRIINILENEGRDGIHRIELPGLVVIMALSNLLDGVSPCPYDQCANAC